MKLKDFIKKHGNVDVDEKELKEILGIEDEKYFVPSEGEEYWYLTDREHVTGDVNAYPDHVKELIKNKEVFRTRDEALEYAKKQRFLLQMKRDFLDNSEEIDWADDNQHKYNIYYSDIRKCIETSTLIRSDNGTLVTTNLEWLKEYIEQHEVDIKKHYFGIDEQ